MALDTFNPPRPPSEGTDDEGEFQVIEVKFGDGYSQRAGNGLNPLKQTYSVVWNRIPKAEGEVILDFIRDHAGSEAFFWTPPDEAVALKFICKRFRRAKKAGGKMDVIATFERVYDQGS